MYKSCVPETRHSSQTVDSFTLPKSLLQQALDRAYKLDMSKSGYFRYCLAKELGYTEEESLEFSEDGSAKRNREKLRLSIGRPDPSTIQTRNFSSESTLQRGHEAIAEASLALNEPSKSLSSPPAGESSGGKGKPARGNAKYHIPRRSSQEQAPAGSKRSSSSSNR